MDGKTAVCAGLVTAVYDFPVAAWVTVQEGVNGVGFQRNSFGTGLAGNIRKV